MAKRKATTKKSVRGGTPAQHAKAGKLGGLAPHSCRGRECSTTEYTATKAKAAAKKAASKTKKTK